MSPLDGLFARLQGSAFRRQFKLNAEERDYLVSHGIPRILEHAAKLIAERLAPAHPHNDGKQTPYRGHPVFVAQHATATCCRGCMEQWHGIRQGQALSPGQQAYIQQVLAYWLQIQQALPEPPRRKPRLKRTAHPGQMQFNFDESIDEESDD